MKNFSTRFLWGALFFILILSGSSYSQWVKTNYPSNRQAIYLTTLDNRLFCVADTVGTYFTDDNGSTWTLPDNNNGHDFFGISSIIQKGGCLYAGTNGMGIFCTSDNAATWQEKNTGLPSYPAITALCTNNNRIFAGIMGKGIYVSDDDGANWTAANTGLPTSAWIISFNTAGNNVYAGTFGKGAYYSSDNGANWAAVNNGFSEMSYVYDFASNGDNVYAAVFPGGLYVTNDNGANWNKLNSLFSVSEVFVYNNNIFITGLDNSMSNTIAMSSDSGSTWTDIKTGLPDSLSRITSLTVINNAMFVSVKAYHNMVEQSEGVWRRPISELITAVSGNNNPLPNKYSLVQNYPNPFNPSTAIKYNVVKEGMVNIKVFDMLGREVAALVDEQKSAGEYEIQFNAAGLSSGTYICRLSVNGFVQTIKMSLLR